MSILTTNHQSSLLRLPFSPPLCVITHSPNAVVTLALNQPLSGSTLDTRRSFWIDLLRHAFLLHICLTKQINLSNQSSLSTTSPSTASYNDHVRINNNKINSIHAQIKSLLQTAPRVLGSHIPNSWSISDALKYAGLDPLFPLIVGLPPDTPDKLDLKPMVTLNQVVILALQLRQDVNLTNHKYIAHQVALLYQSITGSRDDLKPFRSQIESQFDAIKAVCSAAVPEPVLTTELKQWLHTITSSILSHALFTSNNITPCPKALEFIRSL